MPDIQAVVFDLGGTLWFDPAPVPMDEVDAIQAAAVSPLLARWGITLARPLDTVVRDIWDAGMAEWQREWDRRTYREPPLPSTIRRVLATVDGIDLSAGQAEEWWRAAWLGPERLRLQLYPDVFDVLTELRSRGVRIGACSNRPCTNAMMMADLDTIGVAEYVDAAVASGEAGFVKPHRAPFEAIVAALGVDAPVCVMVGDSCEADMLGGRSVGMLTVLKLNGRYGSPRCEAADHEIHDLHELLALPVFDGPQRLASAMESATPHEDGNEDRY